MPDVDYLIDWLGFLGAWLLVAGPLNQASIELGQEDHLSREEIEARTRRIEPEPRVSPWWWLIPPVGFWKNHQRSNRQQQKVMESLPAEQIRVLVSFLNKATAWFLVAAGASLIATKETWEVTERMEWPLWAFFALGIAAFLVATGYTVERARRSQGVVDEAERRHGSATS